MKNDSILGQEVHKHLLKKKVETPMSAPNIDAEENIKELFAEIMLQLGLDLNDDSLADTPKRVAKMYVNEIFLGLNYDNFPKCTAVENKMKYDEMVCVDKISLQSNCEHHFVIIDGFAKVAYIPKKKVLGLSKINRVVKFFAQRPQIQERLTEQIYHALEYILNTQDIAVQIKATHFCVKARGVNDTHSYTSTTKLGGIFRQDASARNEFLNL